MDKRSELGPPIAVRNPPDYYRLPRIGLCDLERTATANGVDHEPGC